MRTGVAIGTGIGGLFLAIIVGIATLPDEVLLESEPNSKENSQFIGPALEESNIMNSQPTTNVALPVIEEPPSKKEKPKPTVQEEDQTPMKEDLPKNEESFQSPSPSESDLSENPSEQKIEDEPTGNVIKIEVRDGVGSKDK